MKAIVFTAMCVMSAQCVTASELVCEPHLKVFYGNGMRNSVLDAKESSNVLKQAIEERNRSLEIDKKISHGRVINPSESIGDFFESVDQKLNLEESQLWLYFSGVEAMPDEMKEILTNLATKSIEISYDAQPELRNHVNIYDAALLEGNKVIVVSHSQGNLFANQAYNHIHPQYRDAWGMVAVANPATYVADGGPNTTITEDLVMYFTPGSMEANFSNFDTLNANDWSGHRFVESYMVENTLARRKVVEDVFIVEEGLQVAPEVLGGSALHVALSWKEHIDLDLITFEPDGTHVYYANKEGNFGLLHGDALNDAEKKIEHYSVPCTNVVEGEFQFGVNYFAGYYPDTATMVVKTPDETRTRTLYLEDKVGSAGNKTPSIMFELDIVENEDGELSYSIE
ncbi:hypothetical protein JCM19231_1409 [Vibrio ishigakensis]|uniref:Uncharacterized protein n=1 Tax=Vibrio ishigakensis TaxID=1481914 RepID=A0A0B8P3R1_9VIBR|nr:hypothetical protein [Vibrio ishigakensis]GAM57898.1 hypothetical protein JCM19231_1409 [Vibrio ishigakensis]